MAFYVLIMGIPTTDTSKPAGSSKKKVTKRKRECSSKKCPRARNRDGTPSLPPPPRLPGMDPLHYRGNRTSSENNLSHASTTESSRLPNSSDSQPRCASNVGIVSVNQQNKHSCLDLLYDHHLSIADLL